MLTRTIWVVGVAAGALCAAGALGQQQQAAQPLDANLQQSSAGSPLYWDADLIMRPFVSAMTRYYNLDEEQEKYTRMLMTQRVKRFLSQHERDTRALFAEYWDYQTGGQLPPPEAAQEFARRARPLMAAIYKEIIDGNLKWREILNDDQKKKHDKDLEAIDRTFKEFDVKFDRWSRGEVQPADVPSTIGDQPRGVMRPEDAWQYYVRMFIQDYRLDEGQQAAALSVLDELRKEAASYRTAHKDEFAELEARYQELTQSGPKTDPAELAEARAKREALDKRRQYLEGAISVGMFNRLKQKLLVIPRSDQRESYDKRKQMLDEVAQRARAELEARTSSQPAAASQPAGSRPSSPRAARPARSARSRPRGNR